MARGLSTFCLVFLTLVVPAQARPVSTNLWQLLDRSEQVWRGEILRMSVGAQETCLVEGQEVPLQWVVAEMRVDQAVIGEVPEGGVGQLEFAVSFEKFVPYVRFMPGEYVLVFLSAQGGQLRLTDPYEGARDLPRPETPGSLPTGAPQEILAKTLAQFLSSDPPAGFWAALQLGHCPRPDLAVPLLRPWVSAPDPATRGDVFGALVQLGDAASLPALFDFLAAPPQEGQAIAMFALSGLSPERLGKLAQDYHALSGGTLAGALAALLSHADARVREEAAYGMRTLAEPSSVEALVAALDDQSLGVRYQALQGLAQIVRKFEWAPAVTQGEEAIAAAVDLWKGWWTAEGRAQYGASP